VGDAAKEQHPEVLEEDRECRGHDQCPHKSDWYVGRLEGLDHPHVELTSKAETPRDQLILSKARMRGAHVGGRPGGAPAQPA